MVLCWVASALIETEKSFRRILGYEKISKLLAALGVDKAKLASAERAA